MKASIFIKVALIDQMQQIADLGLWFHLAKLIPSGVEVLAMVSQQKSLSEDGEFAWPDSISSAVSRFYSEFAPEYSGKYSASKEFFSVNPKAWLVSDQQGADHHLKNTPTGEGVIYVPQWFEDFKGWCTLVLNRIESGELKDIEVLKMGEE
jgi:hypothetical protein